MWLVPPDALCRQHLTGEHVEMHMLVGTIAAGKRLDGYLARGLVEPANIAARHDALAAEMTRRGMHHHSPLQQPDVSRYDRGHVDVDESRRELRRRCKECAP
jgi:hypothetical protein